jgi:hypothetical protein
MTEPLRAELRCARAGVMVDATGQTRLPGAAASGR